MNLEHFPSQSGIYIMKDVNDKIIYIGKANNLKKRLLSYFSKDNKDIKTHFLVEKIAHIQTIITNNTKEALILENQLIKKHLPHYNIQLKDGKSYLSLAVDYNSPFPRIYTTRESPRKKVRYFGPYPSAQNAKALVKIAEQFFFLRPCKVKIPLESKASKTSPCSLYWMKKCYGACIWKESPESYQKRLKQFLLFLNGRFSSVAKWITLSMKEASDNLNFEQAGEYRDLLSVLTDIQEKQKVYFSSQKIIDIIGYYEQDNKYSFVILRFQYGVFHSKQVISTQSTLSKETILATLLEKIYVNSLIMQEDLEESFINQSVFDLGSEDLFQVQNLPHEIILPVEASDLLFYDDILKEFHKNIPLIKTYQQIRSLLNSLPTMAFENALSEWKQQYKVSHGEYALLELQKLLHLKNLPHKIETYDISNIGEYYAVGSCVSFVNAFPNKEGYRIFKIKHTQGQNDFAMIEEILARRLDLSDTPYPDLIVIDGGKGQVSSAQKVLVQKNIDIPVIGLAKKLELIVQSYGKPPIKIPVTHPSLQLLMAGRDEAHRFANSLRKKIMTKKLFENPAKIDDK